MAKHVPRELSEVILPFDWDVTKVWALSTHVESIPRIELDYLLHLPLWSSRSGEGMLFDIAPITVISNPETSNYQAQRLAATNLQHPIDLLDFEGRKWILDGVHRLAKHYQEGTSQIDVRIHNEKVIDSISVGI